jgi:hypothetical protein
MPNTNPMYQFSEPLHRLYPSDFFPPQKCETFIPSPSGSRASSLHNKHNRIANIVNNTMNKDTQEMFNKLYQSIKKASVLTERDGNQLSENTDSMLLNKLESKCNKIISLTRQFKALKMLKPEDKLFPPIYNKRYDDKENTIYNLAFLNKKPLKKVQMRSINRAHPRVLNPFRRILCVASSEHETRHVINSRIA